MIMCDRFVGDLWRYVRDAAEEAEDSDDGFGPAVPAKDRKGKAKKKGPVTEKVARNLGAWVCGGKIQTLSGMVFRT